jgi:iron complex transport system substrate-binding protein
VVRANPDVIMLGNRSMQARALYPGWDSIPAVRAQRVCVFDAVTSELIVRPGPRLAEGARAMARCLAEKLGGKGQ